LNPADLEGLRQAVLGAQNFQAPPSSLGASQAPELAQLYATDFQLPGSTAATGALAQGTADLVKAQQAAASSGGGGGRTAKGDGGKYTVYSKKDGGFGFKGPDGQEISASDYASATGKSLDSVLKNSRNPVDRAFLQDYKQLNAYINNKLNSKNDAKARSAAQSVETQVRKLYNIPLHQQTPDSLINAFVQAYPTVFGGTAAGKQGLNTLLPSKSSQKKTSTYSLGAGR
jgi:hypothetical protein